MSRKILAFCLLITACQTPPQTKVTEEKSSLAGTFKPKINSKTILIDARSPLKYSLGHPAQAISLQWEEFSQKEKVFQGRLETDLYFHARRLARLGIAQDSEVIILGDSQSSEGLSVAGRLAWTFRRMGIVNTKFADIHFQRFVMTTSDPIAREEVSVWKPHEDDSLEVNFGESREELKKSPVVILDLREKNVSKVNPEKAKLDTNCDLSRFIGQNKVVHFDWRELMQIDNKLSGQLNNLGLKKSDRIYVLDETAIKSAAATVTLRDLGFLNSSTWVGGSTELCYRLMDPKKRR